MRLREYFARLRDWEEQYGKPKKRKQFDLSKVNAKCTKCRKARKRMSRHHKGNDMLWANLYPDEFAPRYIEFRDEDIALLCNRCHRKIHEIYDAILYDFWLEWAIERTDNLSHKPSVEECRDYQQQCTEEFEKWVKVR